MSCSKQEPRADVDRGAGERAAERAYGERPAQPRDGMVGSPGLRVGSAERGSRDEDTGLLPGVRDVESRERPPQHVVHPEAHVLDASAREDDDIGGGVRGDQRRDILERVEGAGEAQKHDPGAGDEVGIQRHRAQVPAQARGLGVRRDRALTGERVLMHADPGGTGIRCPEGERAVLVADHDDAAGPRRIPLRRGLVEEETVCRVRRGQVRGVGVGEAPQGVGGVGHPASLAHLLLRERAVMSG